LARIKTDVFSFLIFNFQGPFERHKKYPSLVREREGQKNNPKSAFLEKFLKFVKIAQIKKGTVILHF